MNGHIWKCPVILILASNEQISRSVGKASISGSLIYSDVNTFIRNSHMQISFVTSSSMDITVETIRKDIEDIDTLLGEPYQKLLSSETGLDNAVIALKELKEKTSKVSSIVSDLLMDCELAKQASKALLTEIQEMARQLFSIQQKCTAKDRPLCFTIQFSGFDVTLPLNNITSDVKLQQINTLRKDGTFNKSIDVAQNTYEAIPMQLVQDSLPYALDIKSRLSRKRTGVYKSTHDLDILAGTLTQELSASQEAIFTLLENVVKWDLWRWLAILGIAATVSLIWGLWICAAPCGCGITSKTPPLLVCGIILSCLMSVNIWAVGTAYFLVGSHGQSLICHPLYDHPYYPVLAEFLDVGGIMYKENGFFSDFSGKNDTLKISNVLKACQRDLPVYHTFHLQNKIDLNNNLNYKTWDDLDVLFHNFTSFKCRFEILSPALQLNLEMLLSNTANNFAGYREMLSSSITKRDLGSFADQLNNLGRQLSDSVMSRKIDNLAFSMRKVLQNEMQRLNDLRGRILYKITTLEVLLPPLNRQVNQSLSHLKTIQFFLDNQAWQISERLQKRNFKHHLAGYIANNT